MLFEMERKKSCRTNRTSLSAMDFDTAVTEIGEFGRFQKKIFYITNLLAFPISAQMLVMVFVAEKPTWSCKKGQMECNTDG